MVHSNNPFERGADAFAFQFPSHNTTAISATGQLANQMNKPLPEDRSLDMLKSKRFSISGGLGDFSDHFPTVSFHESAEYVDKFDMRASEISSPKKPGASSKRRLSNLGLLSSSFFDEHSKVHRRGSMSSVGGMLAQAKIERRGSMTSVGTFASEGMPAGDEHDDDDEDDGASVISEVGDNDNQDMVLPSPSFPFQSFQPPPAMAHARPIVQFYPPQPSVLVGATQMKQIMETFTESMTQSLKSQQAIHDWDRKMGLKRSHSKTMRLSMRSRKKLKAMIKKNLASKRN